MNKENSKVVALAQPGDIIQVTSYARARIFNLSLELLNEDDEIVPFFSYMYKCPQGHDLKVFYSRDEELDKE